MSARRVDKTLTRRQKESMQVLMKALTDFVLEDNHELEVDVMSNYDDSDVEEERSMRKSTERRFDESASEPRPTFRVPIPLHSRRQEKLASTCKDLIGESIRLEYSLRTLGAGGPGMYSAWVLRRSLRVVSEVIQGFNLEELFRTVRFSQLSERYVLGCFIDELPGPLFALWEAFDELESFLLDFVSFFHSVDLQRILHSLKGCLAKQYRALQDHKSRAYISPTEGQALRRNLISFFSELEKSFEICTTELSVFRTQGVPLIRSSQQNQSDRYLMLTTISTFFSAVTSATLQTAFQEGTGGENALLATAVNTFFFSSLIFSTASAVQSLLARAWQRSFIRLPEERWAFQWVSKGPLLSLVISGAFFATGLCLFVIASQKDSVTTIFTVTFALLHAIGLISMAIWFIYEQWKFRRQSEAVGRKLTETSVTMSFLAWIMKIWQLRILAPSRSLVSRSSKLANYWSEFGREKLVAENSDMEKPREESDPESDIVELAIEPPSRPGSVASSLTTEERASSVSSRTFEKQYRQSTIEDQGAPEDIVYSSDIREQEPEDSPLTEIAGTIIEQVSESIALEDIPGKIYNIEGGNGEGPSRVEDEQSPPLDQRVSEPRERLYHPDTSRSIHGHAIGQPILNMGIVDEPIPLEYNYHTSSSYAQSGSRRGALLSQPGAQQALPVSEADLLDVRKESWEQGLRQESISYMEMYNRRNPKKKRTYPAFEPPPV